MKSVLQINMHLPCVFRTSAVGMDCDDEVLWRWT